MTYRLPRPPLPEPISFTDRAWYSWLVLSVAITLTGVGTLILERAMAQTDNKRFAAAVTGAEARISQRMETCGALLRGATPVFAGATGIDRPTFNAAMARLDLATNFPGMVSLGWCVPVPAGSEAEAVRWLAAQGYDQPRLWPEPAAGRERTAIFLLEPDRPENRALIGFDPASEPNRREAMLAARQSGEARACGPVALIGTASQTTPGFIVYLPIFTPEAPRTLRGFIFVSLICADLFDPLFAKDGNLPLTLRISDVAAETDPSRILYDTTTETTSEHVSRRRLPLLGRTWEIEYRSVPAFDQQTGHALVPLFASAGVVLGLGLFLLARSQVRAVADNSALYHLSMAARREAELSLDINRRLASTLDPQVVAQAVTDAGRELTGAAFGAFFTTSAVTDAPGVYAVSGEPVNFFTAHGLPRVNALFAATIAGQEVIRLADVRTDPRYTHEPLPAGAPEGHLVVTSYLAVGVRSRTGTILGGLLYAHHEPARFSADHERQLLGLAAQAAIAFDHAQLFAAEREARLLAGQRADDLGQANAQLQQFIYVSSHDLQEPLRTITQFLDLLQRRHGQHFDRQAQRYVTYAAESAARMYALLNDLLTYSRLGHDTERLAVDLNEVAEEVRRDLGMVLSESGARLEIGLLPTVPCDRSKVHSLLQNLIGNAVKFRSARPPLITISAERDGLGMWVFAVADNGIGIKPEHREAVFEVFHRLHDRASFPGTGIGLAICRKVVEQHGGRIWIDGTPGGGATIFFTLSGNGSGIHKTPVTA